MAIGIPGDANESFTASYSIAAAHTKLLMVMFATGKAVRVSQIQLDDIAPDHLAHNVSG
jgi:hypothetical protein